MAASFSTLTVFATDTNNTSFSTSSISPTTGNLTLAIVQSTIAASTGPNQPTLSGNGLTWDVVASIQESNANVSRITLFRARGTASSGAVTADFGGETQTTCGIVVVNITNTQALGTNGSGNIAQFKTGEVSGTNTGITITLDNPFSSSDNATMGFFAIDRGIAMTVGSGFTDAGNTGGSASSLQAEFKATNDSTVDASWASGTTRGMMIAIEIAVAAVTGGSPMFFDGVAIG